ncbi:DUF3466 family protein [Vibrio astriarenae]|uniref:DUF3466 family protein n=1 Tax=Vibrio astriarenae TaxID=1481923 RepID=A0A7Z2T2T3_9VIBR|nr:DUF3466 family protein [Vibrio astriarenae]QIA63306.1 DUF3466 family protein [Vibrio astriarenae]
MSSTNFKLSVVTVSLLSTFSANAIEPMYNVVKVDVTDSVENTHSYNEVHGVAITPTTERQLSILDYKGCFTQTSDVNCSEDFLVAGEARVSVEGVSLRDEAPFAMDASFGYIEDYDSFKSYCYRELLYATCESWARTHWNAWSRQVNTGVQNIQAFVENNDDLYVNTDFNNLINRLYVSEVDQGDGTFETTVSPIGIQSTQSAGSVYGARLGIQSNVELPVDDSIVDYRTWAQLNITDVDNNDVSTSYIVGSSSRVRNNTNGDHFISNATVWKSENGGTYEYARIGWPSGKEKDGERLAQGSIRDIALTSSGIYAVGYNTYDNNNNYYEASVFRVNDDDTFVNVGGISGARVKNSDGDVVYSNTQLVSMNDNGVAIGESKLYGSRPENGAAANKPFVVENIVSNRSAKYLQSYGQSLFFTGVGADLGAINNFNEIVGTIDASQARENDGQPRRRRGFIYTVPNMETSKRAELYNNKAWLLDDLTNDGNPNGINNHYRIIAASDINDAGVISATAIYCADGYDDTTHNSYCGNQVGVEEVVAVKLVPNPLALINEDGEITDDPEIAARGVNDPPVDRQGAGFGWLFLVALGFLGFRRK